QRGMSIRALSSGRRNWRTSSRKLSAHEREWNRSNQAAPNPAAAGVGKNNLYSHLRDTTLARGWQCPDLNVTPPSWRPLCLLEAGATPEIRTLLPPPAQLTVLPYRGIIA